MLRVIMTIMTVHESKTAQSCLLGTNIETTPVLMKRVCMTWATEEAPTSQRSVQLAVPLTWSTMAFVMKSATWSRAGGT
jgi:hypothetical protein